MHTIYSERYYINQKARGFEDSLCDTLFSWTLPRVLERPNQKENMDRCPTCDSVEFSIDEHTGSRTCLVCGELTEGFQLQVVEEEVQGGFFRLLSQSQSNSQPQGSSPERNTSSVLNTGAKRGRNRVKSRPIRLRKEHVDETVYILAMQWVLDRQTI